jgi:gamma-glutamylcyclotransferase (GGCT)/AIG2-like uncharacterized protein YtfP
MERGMLKRIDNGKYEVINNKRYRIFVYGSLKRKCSNHKLLKERSTFIHTATTINTFAMYKAQYGNFPRLVSTQSTKGKVIHGELYDLFSDEVLKELDKFEGEQYTRIKIQVQTSMHEREKVFVYINEYGSAPKNVEFLNKWTEQKPKISRRHILKNLHKKIEFQKKSLSESR